MHAPKLPIRASFVRRLAGVRIFFSVQVCPRRLAMEHRDSTLVARTWTARILLRWGIVMVPGTRRKALNKPSKQ